MASLAERKVAAVVGALVADAAGNDGGLCLERGKGGEA